jgi:hypothetical protein
MCFGSGNLRANMLLLLLLHLLLILQLLLLLLREQDLVAHLDSLGIVVLLVCCLNLNFILDDQNFFSYK